MPDVNTPTLDYSELIKRARLAAGLGLPGAGGASGPLPVTGLPEPPTVSTGAMPTKIPVGLPTQQPGLPAPPPSDRERALGEYKQQLNTPPPSLQDYHPSVGRRILAGLFGGLAGLHDPRSGYEVGHGIAYGPLNQQLTDYQRKLAQKRTAYETEVGEEESKAKVGFEAEKGEAAKETAEAREKEAGAREELSKYKIEHPTIPGAIKLARLTLKNGEEILAQETPSGMVEYGTGMPIGQDAYDPAKSVPFAGLPKAPVEKPPREGEAGYIDKWTQEHKRPPTAAEQLQLHKDYEAATRKPEDTNLKDFHREIQMQSAREVAKRAHQKNLDLSTNQLDRIERSMDMINTSKPEDLALAIPEILTALVSGQASGVRITQPEMNRMISARGWGESIEAFVNKIRGLGDLSSKQKEDLKGLLSDVKEKVSARQQDISDLLDKIDSAKDPSELGKAQIEFRKKQIKGQSNITPEQAAAELERRKKAKSAQ